MPLASVSAAPFAQRIMNMALLAVGVHPALGGFGESAPGVPTRRSMKGSRIAGSKSGLKARVSARIHSSGLDVAGEADVRTISARLAQAHRKRFPRPKPSLRPQ